MCNLVREIVLWTEAHSVTLMVRYIPGKKSILAGQLSCPDEVLPTEWSLMRFAKCSVVFILTCLLQRQAPSFPCTFHQFPIPWLRNRTHLNIPGTTSAHAPFPLSLCFVSSCRKFFFQQGSPWFSSCPEVPSWPRDSSFTCGSYLAFC